MAKKGERRLRERSEDGGVPSEKRPLALAAARLCPESGFDPRRPNFGETRLRLSDCKIPFSGGEHLLLSGLLARIHTGRTELGSDVSSCDSLAAAVGGSHNQCVSVYVQVVGRDDGFMWMCAVSVC